MYETKVSVDRSGRRKEMVRWPQVDERRQNEGRRFSDCEANLQGAVDREVDRVFAQHASFYPAVPALGEKL